MKRLLTVLVIILLLGTFSFGSCTSSTPTTTSTQQPTTTTTTPTTSPTTTTALPPIKIGHIVDLTGPEAIVGKEIQAAFDYAFATVGNLVAGRQVQIIYGDGQGSASTAVDVARKMVENDKVVAIFGPTQIGEKMAVASYMKQAGIPLIFYNPSTLNVFTDNKWVIGAGGSTTLNSTCMADYLYNHLGYRSIITLTQDNSAGRSFMELADYFVKLGGTVVQQQYVPVPCSDFAPYLTTLKTADALVAWDSGSDAIGLLTAYHQLGIDKKIPLVGAFHGGFLDPFIPAAMAPEDAASVVGVLAPMAYAPDSQDPINLAFVKGLTEKTGFPPGDDGASGPCQGAMLFMEAVKATGGDTTPSKLIQAILSTKFTGPEGPEFFAAGSQVATKNLYIVKVAKVPNANAYHYVTVYTYNAVPPTGYTGK